MHGCILSLGEKNVLLLAEGGSGKSSIAAEALARGYSVLCDDNFIVWQNQDQLECTPFEEEFCIQKTPRIKIPRTHFAKSLTPQNLSIDCVVNLRRGSALPDTHKSDIFSILIDENPFALVYTQLSQRHFSLLTNLAKKWKASLFLPEISPFDRAKLWEIFVDKMAKMSLE